MALYEKDPENSRYEKFLCRVVKIMGGICIVGGAHGLYVFVPEAWHVSVVSSKEVYNGWAILNVAKKVALIIFGISLIIYYKKFPDVFSRPWISISFLIFLTLIILINFIAYQPTFLARTWFEISTLIFSIGAWFYFRKKYPEEFGSQS